jgi:hypothetical protein
LKRGKYRDGGIISLYIWELSPLNVLVELLFPSAKTIFIIDDGVRVMITLAIFIIDDGVRVTITLHSTLALGAFLCL